MTVRIEANIAFQALQNQDGVWTAVCDPLGLTVEGESWGDLWRAVEETLNIMLRDLFNRNELTTFLSARGWTMVRPPEKKSNRLKFDVPFRVDRVAANESGQRVYS